MVRCTGAPGATRTRNLRIRSPLLYPLSYGGTQIIIEVIDGVLKNITKNLPLVPCPYIMPA